MGIKGAKRNKGFFTRKAKRIQKALRTIEVKTTAMADEHSQNAFDRQGFTDKSFRPWAKRKREGRRKGRAILVDTSIMKNTTKARSRTTNKGFIITVSSPRVYAAYHNYGTDKIPRRQFVGRSKRLESKIKKYVARKIYNVLKK